MKHLTPSTLSGAFLFVLLARRGTRQDMLRAVMLSLIVLLLSALNAPLWAQQSGDYGLPAHIHKRVLGIEQDYERMIQSKATEFRLIRSVEPFPKISGKTVTVPVILTDDDMARLDRPDSPPVIAALHDRRTGKPLASCKAPCEMESPRTPPAMLTIYRYGSKPEHYGSERYTTYKKPATLFLGFNEVDYQLIRDECAKTSELYIRSHQQKDAEACYRLPPLMPFEARRSGHCITTFDVSEYGETMNVVIEACTDSIFCAASLDSVVNWIYHPAIKDSLPVQRFAVESKVTYRLADEAGRLIPEPQSPVMELCIGSV